jgi:glycosyltransferase involved in cell wall biosynthesis
MGGSKISSLGKARRTEPGLASIVTITYNSARTLQRTIDSVAAQTYPSVQYIIIDGGSTDETLEVVRSREQDISVYVSEKDAGISDAFNRGIALARGEFVAIVNSDDWIEQEHLSTAIDALRGGSVDFVFGDVRLHRDDGSPAGRLVGDRYYRRKIRHLMPFLNHPSMVCYREAYRKFGLYRLDYRNAMDYEWFLRATILGARGLYVPSIVSHMSLAGISDREFNRSLAEVRAISVSYGYPAVPALLRFYVRVCKGLARRTLAKTVPAPVYEWLRELVNTDYRSNAR